VEVTFCVPLQMACVYQYTLFLLLIVVAFELRVDADVLYYLPARMARREMLYSLATHPQIKIFADDNFVDQMCFFVVNFEKRLWCAGKTRHRHT
jgi:hypothetical protein